VIAPFDGMLASAIETMAHRLEGAESDFDPLISAARDVEVVLLGEATHGTHEFYAARTDITMRLIRELGFDAVAIEGDWPDAAAVHRYVIGTRTGPSSAVDALAGFDRFPAWMWRNTELVRFVEGLRAHDASARVKVGFYGLDLYAMERARAAVLAYLDRHHPESAARARARYSCFDRFDDPQSYGYHVELGFSPACEGEVMAQLLDLRRLSLAKRGDAIDEEMFDVVQNAHLIASAEKYYRSMFAARDVSWNLRDRHMFQVLEAIIAHRRRRELPGKVVVWAHNSHLGDARATDRSTCGELNVGQLVRESFGARALLVGFSTYQGTVTAARDWDRPAERRRVRPALRDSYEALFHDVRMPRFLLSLRDLGEASGALAERRLQRAIGVVYRPETERHSHYVETSLPRQFDFVLHYDRTGAVEPLERTPHWVTGEPPETYPTAL
jgi:erythromycin esterase-like protein